MVSEGIIRDEYKYRENLFLNVIGFQVSTDFPVFFFLFQKRVHFVG